MNAKQNRLSSLECNGHRFSTCTNTYAHLWSPPFPPQHTKKDWQGFRIWKDLQRFAFFCKDLHGCVRGRKDFARIRKDLQLILQGFARICNVLQTLVTICKDLYRFVWICKDLFRFVKVCKDLQTIVTICADSLWFAWIRKDLQRFANTCNDLQGFV